MREDESRPRDRASETRAELRAVRGVTAFGAAIGLLMSATNPACGDARAYEAKGPADEPGWIEINCRETHEHCNDEARRVCGGAFEVAENKGRYDVAPGAPFYSGRMLIRCASND